MGEVMNMKRGLLRIFLMSILTVIMGCSSNERLRLIKPVDVFGEYPQKLEEDPEKVIGTLGAGEEVKVLSLKYEKDYAVYKVDLSETSLGVDHGFIYFDSRYMEVVER